MNDQLGWVFVDHHPLGSQQAGSLHQLQNEAAGNLASISSEFVQGFRQRQSKSAVRVQLALANFTLQIIVQIREAPVFPVAPRLPCAPTPYTRHREG